MHLQISSLPVLALPCPLFPPFGHDSVMIHEQRACRLGRKSPVPVSCHFSGGASCQKGLGTRPPDFAGDGGRLLGSGLFSSSRSLGRGFHVPVLPLHLGRVIRKLIERKEWGNCWATDDEHGEVGSF